MANKVCPVWVGYLLINPLRKLMENPKKLLGPLVSPGMTILEPGCGMGYFSLPLARMAGSGGRVLAVDIQEGMLSKLRSRAANAGLASRIETRLADGVSLRVEDYQGQVDLAAAIHVVHEVPDQKGFFQQVFETLKSKGRLLLVEPKGHVSKTDFEKSLKLAAEVGFDIKPLAHLSIPTSGLLLKP
jgi:ubiquinone/menaquinone biosynthesis C-methylase UbiE